MTFNELLKQFRLKRGFTQVKLAAEAGLTPSYVNLLEKGNRNPPRREKLLAIAGALGLSEEEKNTLLISAGHAPQDIETRSDFESPAMKIISDLLNDSGIHDREIVENVVVSFVGWLQSALKQGTLDINILGPRYVLTKENHLSNEEDSANEDYSILLEYIDNEILKPLKPPTNFESYPAELAWFLEVAAKKGDWEIRRKIAEALPELIRVDHNTATKIIEILREDYDDYWRTDIRRRTVEALPGLYTKDPEFVKSMLRFRKRDQIYTIIAITEVVSELESIEGNIGRGELSRLLKKDLSNIDEYQVDVKSETAQYVISTLSDLMKNIYAHPEKAIAKMRDYVSSKNRYIRICVARNAERLIKQFTHEVLAIMERFLRPDEHENVRRPIAKSLPAIVEESKNTQHFDVIERIINGLTSDRDLVIRRSVSDMLMRLVTANLSIASEAINYLKNDKDYYIRSKAKMADLALIHHGGIGKESEDKLTQLFRKQIS